MEWLIAVAIIGTFIIAGAFSYLLGKNKALKAELKRRQINEELERAESRSHSPTSQYQQILSQTPKEMSPQILAIETELDDISRKLDFDSSRPKAAERRQLEERYDQLIGEMVSFFGSEVDRRILTSSLTGVNDERREEGKESSGTQEAPQGSFIKTT